MKNTIWLLLFVFGLIITAQKVRADLTCNPACEAPTSICAIDPDGAGTGEVTVENAPGVHPNSPWDGLAGRYYISGCGIPEPEIGPAILVDIVGVLITYLMAGQYPVKIQP